LRASFAITSLALLVSTSAHAADCASPYTVDATLADLVVVESALREDRTADATEAAKRMEAGIACLDEVLTAQIVGRTYRAIGAGLFVGGASDRGRAWMRSGFEVDPTFVYGVQDIPAGHPVAVAYDDLRKEMAPEPMPATSDLGAGSHYLDGRRIYGALATNDRPHLYQLKVDAVTSFVIEGSAFPDAAFGVAEVAEVGKQAKTKKVKPEKVKARPEEPSQTTASGVTIIERERPLAKTPLMVVGSAIIASAGGVYYYSSVTRRQFSDSTVRDDIERYRAMTNRLVLASGAVLAVGTGTLAWGVALEGGAPIPAMTIRF
jgi:hypothetical protein